MSDFTDIMPNFMLIYAYPYVPSSTLVCLPPPMGLDGGVKVENKNKLLISGRFNKEVVATNCNCDLISCFL